VNIKLIIAFEMVLLAAEEAKMENLVCKFGLVESVEAVHGIPLPFPWKVAENGEPVVPNGTLCPTHTMGEDDVQEEPPAAEEDADLRLSQRPRLKMMRSERWGMTNDPQRPEMESEPVTTAEKPFEEEEQRLGRSAPRIVSDRGSVGIIGDG